MIDSNAWEQFAIDSLVGFSMQHAGNKHISSYYHNNIRHWTKIYDNSECAAKEACDHYRSSYSLK